MFPPEVSSMSCVWCPMLLLNKNGLTETLLDVSPQILQRRYLVTNAELVTVQYVIDGPQQILQLAGIRIAEHPI